MRSRYWIVSLIVGLAIGLAVTGIPIKAAAQNPGGQTWVPAAFIGKYVTVKLAGGVYGLAMPSVLNFDALPGFDGTLEDATTDGITLTTANRQIFLRKDAVLAIHIPK